MKKWVWLLIALTAGTAHAATVWKWVDANGVTHYSDRPVEGAEAIELSSAQSIPLATPRAPAPSTRASGPQSSSAAERGTAQPYTRFDVTSPGQQETLWNIEGTLEVSVAIEPVLQNGHRLDVYLDGQRQNLAATTPTFTVPEVYRGVHTLQAVVVDDAGNEVLRSLAVTFMVQQTSLLNPNNPNSPASRAN